MVKKELLTLSKNDIEVFLDPIHSHAATHFADAPKLKALVIEILKDKELQGEILEFDTDMGRIVGNSDLVENDPGDEIVYAKRKNRDVFTSFNKSQQPQPCATVALSLHKNADGSYELHSAWIGSVNSPPFPGEPNETPESKPYWLSHSLVWGTQEIQLGTETSICPW